MTAVGMVPKMRRYVVAGTIEIGMHEYDSSIAYLSLPLAKEFAGLAGRHRDRGQARRPVRRQGVGAIVLGQLGFRYWVRDWMEMNRSLFAALQLEKLALFVVVTIIVLVAAFAIIGHLVLLVAEKRKEIGILKAVGASVAVDHARVLCRGHDHRRRGHRGRRGRGAHPDLGAEHLQGHPARGRRVPDRSPSDEADVERRPLIIGATLILSFLATIIPAKRAGSLSPVDVLRYE
jgi:lipoprotein-releasing system permease protein